MGGLTTSPQVARRSCQDSPAHTPSPKDEPLATKGGPRPLPFSTGHWLGLPSALVSQVELTSCGRVLSLPAAKAGTSSQHAGQGVPAPSQKGHSHGQASLPLGHQGLPKGLCAQVRSPPPGPTSPAWEGTHMDSMGSGDSRWWDTKPKTGLTLRPRVPQAQSPPDRGGVS